MTLYSIQQAVDIAKAALPMQAGSWISNPDTVAKFIEVVATKINELSKTTKN